MKGGFHTVKEVATMVGVAPITLRRWLISGRIPDVSRDRNNWRVFTDKDVEQIRRFSEKKTPPRRS